MMGIILPETCWACNKICNKYHMLHLVGILFPHVVWLFAFLCLCSIITLFRSFANLGVIHSKPTLPTLTSSCLIDLFYSFYQIKLEVSFAAIALLSSQTSYLLVAYFQDAVQSLRQSCFGLHLYSPCLQDFTREGLPLCNYWPHSEPRACEEPGESASFPFY